MGAVAPRPALSTHPYSKLLGFLAFSYDSSLFQHSHLGVCELLIVDSEGRADNKPRMSWE